jgi:hypothetical protein
MNIVSNHILIPDTRYGYPVVTETPEFFTAQYEHRGYSFDNSRFSKGFRSIPYNFNMDIGAGLYNQKRQVEPLAMDMIGTAIDLYA